MRWEHRKSLFPVPKAKPGPRWEEEKVAVLTELSLLGVPHCGVQLSGIEPVMQVQALHWCRGGNQSSGRMKNLWVLSFIYSTISIEPDDNSRARQSRLHCPGGKETNRRQILNTVSIYCANCREGKRVARQSGKAGALLAHSRAAPLRR